MQLRRRKYLNTATANQTSNTCFQKGTESPLEGKMGRSKPLLIHRQPVKPGSTDWPRRICNTAAVCLSHLVTVQRANLTLTDLYSRPLI